MADNVPSDPDNELVTDETRAEEQSEAREGHEVGRGPTPEEEAAADRSRGSAEGIEDNYRDMTRKGAEIEGEGSVG